MQEFPAIPNVSQASQGLRARVLKGEGITFSISLPVPGLDGDACDIRLIESGFCAS